VRVRGHGSRVHFHHNQTHSGTLDLVLSSSTPLFPRGTDARELIGFGREPARTGLLQTENIIITITYVWACYTVILLLQKDITILMFGHWLYCYTYVWACVIMLGSMQKWWIYPLSNSKILLYSIMSLHDIFIHSPRYHCFEYLFIPNLPPKVYTYIWQEKNEQKYMDNTYMFT